MRGNGLNLQCGVLKMSKAMQKVKWVGEKHQIYFVLNKIDYVPKNIIIILMIIINICNF